jgi:hypothetical protein
MNLFHVSGLKSFSHLTLQPTLSPIARIDMAVFCLRTIIFVLSSTLSSVLFPIFKYAQKSLFVTDMHNFKVSDVSQTKNSSGIYFTKYQKSMFSNRRSKFWAGKYLNLNWSPFPPPQKKKLLKSLNESCLIEWQDRTIIRFSPLDGPI